MREEITCDECGKVMTEGYCIDGGREHYCSDECLHKHYTDAEYLEMYDCGNGGLVLDKMGRGRKLFRFRCFPKLITDGKDEILPEESNCRWDQVRLED